MTRVWLVIAVLVVAGLGWWLLSGDEPAGDGVPPVDRVATEAESSPVVASPTEAAPEIIAQVDTEAVPDDVLEIDLTTSPDFFTMLERAGIEDAEEKLARWGLARGYPQFDAQGNPLLDQPYDQYDDETLRAFADNEDMWAQQILAERLAKSRPAEALELYRRAAINGSVHAMSQMARLYKQLSTARNDTRFDDDEQALAQLYALRDGPESLAVTGYAWAAVAERAGWDPLRGGMTANLVGSKLNDEQLAAACEFASSIYGGLVDERTSRGLDEYDTHPPPIVFDTGSQSGTACYDEQVSGQLDSCQEVQVRVGDQSSRFWKCDD